MELFHLTIVSEKNSNGAIRSLSYNEPLEEVNSKFHHENQCCDMPEIIENRGLYVCKNCAIVHGPIMNNYITYDLTVNNIHTGKEYNYSQRYYGSRTIFFLEKMPANKRAMFQRLLKLNHYFHNSYEYNMTLANQTLFKIASQLEIPSSIKQQAMQIYLKVVNKRLTIGRSIKFLIIASLYIACQLNACSRNIEEFSKSTQIPIKTLRRNYRLILNELNMKIKHTSVSYYLTQFSIRLGLSVSFQTSAKNLLILLAKFGFNENSSPKGFALAAIYITSKKIVKEKRVNQQTLSDISNVSEVTIRKYIKMFKSNLDFASLKVAGG